MNDKGAFNIGKRNQLIFKKILWKSGLMVHAEETGGTVPRTVRMDIASGRAFLRAGSQPECEWPLRQRSGISQGGAL
jgi:chemotaxis protein CheD